MLRPMTKGNLILLKGERNTGKTSLAVSTIKSFLAEPGTKAVYIGMSGHGREITEQVNSPNLITFGVDDDSHASYVLGP